MQNTKIHGVNFWVFPTQFWHWNISVPHYAAQGQCQPVPLWFYTGLTKSRYLVTLRINFQVFSDEL